MSSLQVYVRGGSGGTGAATFKVMAKKQRGQANGGSGGRGGDVTLVRHIGNVYLKLVGATAFPVRMWFRVCRELAKVDAGIPVELASQVTS